MNMADETISEKCETLYNKLNTFVTNVINRDVQPQINDLESDVNSLNNSITNITTTETTTINPSNVSGANPIYFTLLGDKFVKLSWIDNSVTVTSSSVGSYKVLGTLPEKYRPTSQVWFTQAYSLNLDKGRQTSLCIMTNGQVQLYCWWTGTSQATPCVFSDIYSLF